MSSSAQCFETLSEGHVLSFKGPSGWPLHYSCLFSKKYFPRSWCSSWFEILVFCSNLHISVKMPAILTILLFSKSFKYVSRHFIFMTKGNQLSFQNKSLYFQACTNALPVPLILAWRKECLLSSCLGILWVKNSHFWCAKHRS